MVPIWSALALVGCGETAATLADDGGTRSGDPSAETPLTTGPSASSTGDLDATETTSGEASTTLDDADTTMQDGSSGAPTCSPMPGVWADCVDGGDCMNAEGTCVSTGQAGEGSCVFTPAGSGCEDACECPPAPDTGMAVVTCADIPDANGDLDGVNSCYLSCDNGEPCPQGQICFQDLLCVHTNTPPGPPVEPYQGCDPPLFPCHEGATCLQDDSDNPTVGTCAEHGCAEDTDCPQAPEGGTPVCSNVDGIPGLECSLLCTNDEGCPTDATCFGGLCAFPTPIAGYQPCVPLPTCQASETCHQLGGDPSYSVCAQQDCQDAADCPIADYGGDAPITCGDTGSGTTMCYLDCALDQTCPPGMTCVDNAVCAFESLGEVCLDAISDPSFEMGTPNATWTESSTNTATPLCDANCGGEGAFTGAFWARFGGVLGTEEIGSMTQDVPIPVEATTLVFQLWIFSATTINPQLDTLTITIDGNPVFQATGDDAAAYSAYTFVSADVSEFADGMNHAIRIEGQTQGDEITNFFVDDVLLLCPGV